MGRSICIANFLHRARLLTRNGRSTVASYLITNVLRSAFFFPLFFFFFLSFLFIDPQGLYIYPGLRRICDAAWIKTYFRPLLCFAYKPSVNRKWITKWIRKWRDLYRNVNRNCYSTFDEKKLATGFAKLIFD